MASQGVKSAGRWKPFLVVVGMLVAAATAAVAWGRADPTGEARAEPGAPSPLPASATRDPSQAPAWVRPTIGWTVALVVAVAIGLFATALLREVLSYVVLALFFSFALEPAVNFFHVHFGWRRGSAAGLLLALVVAMFVVTVLVFVPVLIRSVIRIVEELPVWARTASEWTSEHLNVDVSTDGLSTDAASATNSLRSSLDSPISALLGFTGSLIGGLFGSVTVGMFLFYLLADGPRFKRAVLSFFPPKRQDELISIWEAAIDKTGGYFYSKLLLMAINGGLFLIALRLLDVPGAVGLAAFQAFVAAFIPIVGTYVAAIVPLLAAFFSIGMPGTLVLLVYILIYQQVENYLLTPRIQGKVMQLHPAVALGAALAGAAIGGLLWAFLALPFAATVQASASLWIARHDVRETEFTEGAVPAAGEQGRPDGNRVRRWIRSSRGWLRRKIAAP